MKRKLNKWSLAESALAASLALAAGSLGASAAAAQQVDCSTRAPIVFVHGASGSAAQFESQLLRFTSNGWDPSMIRAFEFDSGRTQQIMDQILAGIDAQADELR